MPRQSRGRSGPAPSRAPSRPTVAPRNPMPQQRSASTAAQVPATTQKSQATQGAGSGLFGQMASTAAGVAVGSTIGHALGGFFGGGSAQGMEGQNSTTQGTMNSSGAAGCDLDAKAFTKCLDDNKDGQYQMQVCGWYLEQLKACQQAASNY